MTNSNRNQSPNFAEEIVQACLAIDASLDTVKFLFLHKDVYEIHHVKEGKKEISLEVESDSLMLLCLFDTNQICESVFLLPDDIADMIHCIEYCNTAYPYDRTLKGWIACNRIIQITIYNTEYSLSILPIKQKEGS